MKLRRVLPTLLATGAVALAGTPLAGCGNGAEGRSESTTVGSTVDVSKAESEYHRVLLEFHAAAAAGKIYDAYGFAEYFPPTQRAAVHAFCFVADRMLDDLEAERFADRAYLTGRIRRKAETDMEAERDVVAPGRVHKAIRKLNAVLELGSLDRDLAERYVRACY